MENKLKFKKKINKEMKKKRKPKNIKKIST